jgi:hypothetical protein
MSKSETERPRMQLFDGQRAPVDFLNDVKVVAILKVAQVKQLAKLCIDRKLVPLPMTEEIRKKLEEQTGLNPTQINQVGRFCTAIIDKLTESKIERSVLLSELRSLNIPDETIKIVFSEFDEKNDDLKKMYLESELVLFPFPKEVRWRVFVGYEESKQPFLPIPRVAIALICGKPREETVTYEFEMTDVEFEYLMTELNKAHEEFARLSGKIKEFRNLVEQVKKYYG